MWNHFDFSFPRNTGDDDDGKAHAWTRLHGVSHRATREKRVRGIPLAGGGKMNQVCFISSVDEQKKSFSCLDAPYRLIFRACTNAFVAFVFAYGCPPRGPDAGELHACGA